MPNLIGKLRLSRLFIFSLALLVFSPAYSDVEYQLSITQPEHHLADIQIEFEQVQPGKFEVALPAWRTGKYQILNLANTVRLFNAKDEKGAELNWRKVDKSTWQIDVSKATRVNVSYQIYANQLGTRSRHIDSTHAFIDASGYFMFSESQRSRPLTVKMDVPSGWKSYSGMESFGWGGHNLKAANYDILVDSPIETGISEFHKFKVGEQSYELVIWGEGNYDGKQMAADLKKLSETWTALWDTIPYKRYVYMVHATTDVRGATEHLNSTIIQRKRWTFAPREKYLEFLSTASHEFIHTWNVKAYRPDNLAQYDYLQPNYTNLLWLSEGSTSYFQDQLLLRAGLMEPKEFFKKLAKRVDRSLKTPGNQIQSIAEGSFDSWIGMRGDHARNFSVDIYSEGFLTSWLLDKTLMTQSNNKVSYRDVHRQLHNKHPLPYGFTENDVKAILKDLTGTSYENWWDKHIHQPTQLDFDDLLGHVGLEKTRGKKANSIGYTGITTKDDKGFAKIAMVERESPAWKVGLTTDDVIIAINDLKVTAKDFKSRLSFLKPKQKIKISYFRNDKLQEVKLVLTEDFDKPLKIVTVKNPTEQQKANFKYWLGIDYPEKEKPKKEG